MSIRIISAVALLILVASINACSNDSGTSSGPGAQDPNGFSALLGATFANPRCQNCHGLNEGNQVTVNHQNRSKSCAECHSTPGWQAPFKSFSFAGLSSNEICVAIKNKFQGDVKQLTAHMKGSLLVRWGIEPTPPMLSPAGAAPPGDIGTFYARVDQWAANGAICG